MQHFLGLRICSEEAGSNWARRPEEEEENDLSGRFRPSQLHHILVEVWTQIPLLQALCAYGSLQPLILERYAEREVKVDVRPGRGRGRKDQRPPQAVDVPISIFRIAALAAQPTDAVKVVEDSFGDRATVVDVDDAGADVTLQAASVRSQFLNPFKKTKTTI